VSEGRLRLKLFLDEGVPDSVGRSFAEAGHVAIYLRDEITPGSPDEVVCTMSEENEAILVALDADMRKLARRRGVGKNRFRRLSLIKLSCRESRAAERVRLAMSLIEHEWQVGIQQASDRRLFVEIGDSFIRTER
jgi:predicted nuclease of predicted toxin-antitoxin system